MMLPKQFKIAKVSKETADVFTWELKPALGGKFKFLPGQFNMVYVFGAGEVPISISGDEGTLVHTIRAVGPATRAMQKLKTGDAVGIRGPFGSSWPVKKLHGRDIVFIAGGIGLAPLRPAIYHVLSNIKNFGRVSILFGAKTPGEILYRRELAKWQNIPGVNLDITIDAPAKGWKGKTGFVTKLISGADFDGKNTSALICGPEIMMKFSIDELIKRNVAKDSIYVTLERNMKCGQGLCGRCQLGPVFVCKDGPVFAYNEVEHFLSKKEI
ncbi:MAG: FAD/NAD(P)-binding protein [Elusimicrobia bacterium]|nr:FAD/NAD(P)-binding protein [Elusimicrobiota bacterium]